MPNPAIVERAWTTLCEAFPTFKNYLGKDANDTWRYALERLTDDQIRHGINAVLDGDFARPPDAGAFVKVCKEVAGEVRQFRNPVPVRKRPCDERGKALPWWAYINPALAKPTITEAEVQTFLALKKQHYPDQNWLVTGEDA